MKINFLALCFATCALFIGHISGKPEFDDCSGVQYTRKENGSIFGYPELLRFRDTTDCHKFYYCANRYQPKPYPWECPHDGTLTLYFNPNTTNCGLEKDWNCWPHPEFDPPTTPPPPPTTTKPPRPPGIGDENPLVIDCISSKQRCGMFPNTYGSCDTYVVCLNGKKEIKKCNGGFLFDVKTKECQPANLATCWKEPTAPPPQVRKKGECKFHGRPATTPVQTLTDGIVLQNPMVTNWGAWQPWKYCPGGKYATGMYAWRRLLIEKQLRDFAGIVSVSYLCQQPGGNDTDFIESLAPSLPHDGWPMYYMCYGAVVGFRLNSAVMLTDNVATDNVQAICSCSAPVMKPYDEIKYAPQNGHRGTWTQEQICRRGQAVCGMQTQMQEYKERLWGTWDNTGLNNYKVKCCDVPNPLDTCKVVESRVLVRTCDNSLIITDEAMRCDFESVVGMTMDYEENAKRVDFYTSIGHTYSEAKIKLKEKIEGELRNRTEQKLGKMEYPWDDTVPAMFQDETISSRKLFVPEASKLELYQIVGKCDYFFVRTNRYVKVITSKSGAKQTSIFEV